MCNVLSILAFRDVGVRVCAGFSRMYGLMLVAEISIFWENRVFLRGAKGVMFIVSVGVMQVWLGVV